MIKKITFSNFKKFEEEVVINLSDDITLFVGPNNSGKTTALQVLALWQFLMRKWEMFGKTRKDRGLTVNRRDIYSIPIRESSFLWNNTLTQKRRSEKISIKINVEGYNIIDGKGNKNWKYGFEIKNQTKETFTFAPLDFKAEIPKDVFVNYLPPLSGIQKSEQALKNDESLEEEIGQGLPGQVLRNILLRIFEDKKEEWKWKTLNDKLKEFFGIKLLDIKNAAEIIVEYKPNNWPQKSGGLDINTLGSGALQFLLLAAFSFWREKENSVLLFDEPDSHEHTFLQREVFHWIKKLSEETKMQILIATHSEIFINEIAREKIISFLPKSPKTPFNKMQLKIALDKISNNDAITAIERKWILATEDYTDIDILKEWADVLKITIDWKNIFLYETKNQEAKKLIYFSKALYEIESKFKVLFIRDGDANKTKDLPEFIKQKHWEKNEIENYLIVPNVLLKFVKGDDEKGTLFKNEQVEKAKKFLEEKLPDYLEMPNAKGSDILKLFFKNIYGYEKLQKARYFELARIMCSEEIGKEIEEVLLEIQKYQKPIQDKINQ